MKHLASAITLFLLASAAHGADDPSACRISPKLEQKEVKFAWKGPCKDGWAEGEGILERRSSDPDKAYRYEGTVHQGSPHGRGYVKYVNGAQYEGEFSAGERSGTGIYISPIGDRYDGAWKADAEHGRGSMVYAMGGRYDGDWQAGKYHGRGRVVYPGGRTVEGDFIEGAIPGKRAPVTFKKTTYRMREDQPFGTRLSQYKAWAGIPLDKTWAELDEGERARVKASYPLLDDDDEPPYPTNRPSQLIDWLGRAQSQYESSGKLSLLIHVNEEGKAVKITTFESPDADMEKFAINMYMHEKFKPARCGGKPCAMVYAACHIFTVGY